MAEILRLSEVSRKLGRMPALTDVSVSVYGGRVVGLCGLHGCRGAYAHRLRRS